MDEGRGLLTEREREVLSGEGSDAYRLNTQTNILKRIAKIRTDAEILRENAPDSLALLQTIVCDSECRTPTFRGEYKGNLEFILYKNGSKWDQDYYKNSSITWGKSGGSTGQAHTAEILIRESLVEEMTVQVPILKEFIADFGLSSKNEWEISAAEIRKWFRKYRLSQIE